MITKIRSYINFLLKSTNQHGIHSPFVYEFITKCLYKKDLIEHEKIKLLKHYKIALVKNDNIISITDFGAGSKHFNSNNRKISTIAKRAGISNKRGLLLFKITQYFNTEKILEIGTSLGIATACFSAANPNAKITTLEGCLETAKIAEKQFETFGLKNIHLEVGNFSKTLNVALHNKKYDLIYFDGNHKKEATINYFKQCLTAINNETVFIFDDIHWSNGMEEAWFYIKNHKMVTISIDTYQWGFVFFRKEQAKEHFTIRV
ncbi:MAG: class I SAM-dependent methyltransferase [Flavobacteriaceae bacterium]|nr:class I SAM-dependent methyltransferase [Flavobacteriaceae bacterium]